MVIGTSLSRKRLVPLFWIEIYLSLSHIHDGYWDKFVKKKVGAIVLNRNHQSGNACYAEQYSYDVYVSGACTVFGGVQLWCVFIRCVHSIWSSTTVMCICQVHAHYAEQYNYDVYLSGVCTLSGAVQLWCGCIRCTHVMQSSTTMMCICQVRARYAEQYNYDVYLSGARTLCRAVQLWCVFIRCVHVMQSSTTMMCICQVRAHYAEQYNYDVYLSGACTLCRAVRLWCHHFAAGHGKDQQQSRGVRVPLHSSFVSCLAGVQSTVCIWDRWSLCVALWVGYRIDPLPCHACRKRRLRQEQLAPRIKGLV